ncbi:MAG TPA: signal peptidase I [Acidimicrobiales bacterium]|nr:signal peptidase I [Acidimicrobiales bacterium]
MSSPPPLLDAEEAAPPRRRSRSRSVVEWLIVLAIAILVSLLVRTYVFQVFSIPSGSMEPTLHIGDRILVSKLSVQWGTIHRGDILVFKAPAAVRKACGDDVADLVKRVIGLPGDHLTSKGNTIYVNGQPLQQPWTHNEPIGRNIGQVTVPTQHYFMMGDNEPDSCDSRWWGTVPRSSVIGKAFVRIWPLSRFGFL